MTNHNNPQPPDPKALAAFWAEAQAALPRVPLGTSYRTRCIGTNRDTATQIQKHVAAREKIGTFSLPRLAEKTGQPTPKVGETVILVDFDGVPKAMVRTCSVETLAFKDITEVHTAIDGPRVRALATWKPIHVDHWTRGLAPHGLTVTDDMPVHVERFDLLYAVDAPFYLPAGPAQPTRAAVEAIFARTRASHLNGGLNGEYHVRWIGLDEPSTRQIIDLIVARDKTGTFTLPWIIERTDRRTPKAGDALILIDFAGQPALVVKLTRVYETRFGQITATDTAVDGTPVRDLAVWKPLHTQYWTQLLKPFQLRISDDMPVLIEQFEPVGD